MWLKLTLVDNKKKVLVNIDNVDRIYEVDEGTLLNNIFCIVSESIEEIEHLIRDAEGNER